MVFYHGNCQTDFEIDPLKRSRYGFPALFLTTSIDLARQYALWHYRQTWANGGGLVYQIKLEKVWFDVCEWGGCSSYTPDFRNKIQAWQKIGHAGLWIQNVSDTPQKKVYAPLLSDILVVYNVANIKSITLLESGITRL